MGQIALGIRSLLIKGAVFFVLAALLAWTLAWTLGGTLFPRAERVELASVRFADADWNVRLSVGGDQPGVVRYQLMRRAGRAADPVGAEFADTTELVLTDDALIVGMRHHDAAGGAWVLRRIMRDSNEQSETLDDRLAVELELDRYRDAAE